MPSFIDQHDADIEALASIIQYRNVTKGKIIRWLTQFDESHQPIALKLLQNIRFYDSATVHTSCRTLCSIITAECGGRLDRALFMGLGPPGKSGASMATYFRRANGMRLARYDRMFRYSSEITSLPRGYNGNLVFLDDFIGSGSQAAGYLLTIISNAPPTSSIYLLVIAGYQTAIDGILKEIKCKVFPVDLLQEREKLFSDANTKFTTDEKAILKQYCERTGSNHPYGFENVGSLVIFPDSAPNNTPSILIFESATWKPLFDTF